MDRRPLTRAIYAFLIITILFAGGYYRWMQLIVGVVCVDHTDEPVLICGMHRKHLKAVRHSRTGDMAVIELPVPEWSEDVPLIFPSFLGKTMGTSYRIQIADNLSAADAESFRDAIEAKLKEINRQMSTWDEESEISRFNHSSSTEPISVSTGFAEVVRRALEFSRSTGGAFDPTLQPLLNLWGFGSEGIPGAIPSDEAIAEARKQTGWQKIEVVSASGLKKSEPGVSLALGAIAKGYGVDAVAGVLESRDFENWFVEIGGEVVAKGQNPSGVPWKIGIQYPSIFQEDDRLQGILHIDEGAVATSGDYRNYIEKDGVIHSHILDPRSGRAVLSETASVTVRASNCTDADAVATALFVMGPDEGLAWVEYLPNVEAMFLMRSESGAIIEKFSSGFARVTGYIQTGDVKPR